MCRIINDICLWLLLRVLWQQGTNMSGASKNHRNDRGGAKVRVHHSVSLLHPQLPSGPVGRRLQPNGRGQMSHPLQEMSYVAFFQKRWQSRHPYDLWRCKSFLFFVFFICDPPPLIILHVELRSFLQTLLDLLQSAEDYIRDKVDLTFFTQTLPQLVEHIYSTAFPHSRDKRDVGGNPGLVPIEGTSRPTGWRCASIIPQNGKFHT